MAELVLRMASQLIGYTNAEYPFIVADDLTPEQVARLHWEYNLRFLAEQDKIANEPVSEEQEKAISEAAVKALTEKIPVTKVAEEKTESAPKAEDVAPWEEKPAPAKKPWQQSPKFDDLF